MSDDDDQCVWTVESGSYSDYRVHAAFTTKEFAEQSIADQAGDWSDDYGVSDLPLFDHPARRGVELVCYFQADETYATVSVARDEVHESAIYEWETTDDCRLRLTRYGHRQAHLRAKGLDVERVRKRFAEVKAQILAQPWSLAPDGTFDALGVDVDGK